MSSPRAKTTARRLARYAARYAALKAELQGLGFVCVGSVQTRHLQCGKPTCSCHADPASRHGPYHYWTRKIGGKTASVVLTEEEVPRYREWIANSRTLDRVVRQMRRLSAQAVALSMGRRTP